MMKLHVMSVAFAILMIASFVTGDNNMKGTLIIVVNIYVAAILLAQELKK